MYIENVRKRIYVIPAVCLVLLLSGCGRGKDASSGKSDVAGSAIVQSEISKTDAASSAGAPKEELPSESEVPEADSGAAGQESAALSYASESGAQAEDEGKKGTLSDILGSLSLGGTINSAEDGAFPDVTSGTSAVAGGAIVPGIGAIVLTPLEKNELSQYLGISFSSLEKAFSGEDLYAETSFGVRSYNLGGAVGDRTHQVGMTGSESGGVITKINLYAGDSYKIAGIRSGMDLTAADKAAADAGFEKTEEAAGGLITYEAPDGLVVRVFSPDGVTVDTVTCENG